MKKDINLLKEIARVNNKLNELFNNIASETEEQEEI